MPVSECDAWLRRLIFTSPNRYSKIAYFIALLINQLKPLEKISNRFNKVQLRIPHAPTFPIKCSLICFRQPSVFASNSFSLSVNRRNNSFNFLMLLSRNLNFQSQWRNIYERVVSNFNCKRLNSHSHKIANEEYI